MRYIQGAADATSYTRLFFVSSNFWLHVKASPDSPDSPDSPKRFFEKYDVFLIENGKISDFKLF